jgi:hypothetical protein
MKILAIAKVDPQITIDSIKPYLEAEVRHAWTLYEEGVFREMYTCLDRNLGVVFILECNSVDEAREVLDELPFVRERLIDFEIISLGPFSYYEMLFRDQNTQQ